MHPSTPAQSVFPIRWAAAAALILALLLLTPFVQAQAQSPTNTYAGNLDLSYPLTSGGQSSEP